MQISSVEFRILYDINYPQLLNKKSLLKETNLIIDKRA